MPYVFKEVLEEGEVAADVYDSEDYRRVVEERDSVIAQRDDAIGRAERAEDDAAKMREKYANRFLTTPAAAKKELNDDIKRDTGARSYAELWEERENQ